MKRTPAQEQNLSALIMHYNARSGVISWGYNECVAGVLSNLGIIGDRLNHEQLVDALGISPEDGDALVSGPLSVAWITVTPRAKRDGVVRVLEHIREEGVVDWGIAFRHNTSALK